MDLLSSPGGAGVSGEGDTCPNAVHAFSVVHGTKKIPVLKVKVLVMEKGLFLGFFTNAAGTQTVNKVEGGSGSGDANKPCVIFFCSRDKSPPHLQADYGYGVQPAPLVWDGTRVHSSGDRWTSVWLAFQWLPWTPR